MVILNKALDWKSILFRRANLVLLFFTSLLCLFPIVHILSISLSSSSAAASGKVLLWPVQFTLASYEYVFTQKPFLTAFGISFKRVLLGTAINFVLIVLTAYPLSKDNRVFVGRTLVAWYFVFVGFFGAGLIPFYMVVKSTGLIDTIWALILPGAVPVTSVILVMHFFRGLPKEIEESATIDGAGQLKILWSLFLPLSLPVLVTVTLFTIVGHWNSWFDGLIFMNSTDKYPLQTFLQSLIIKKDLRFSSVQEAEAMLLVSDRTVHSAQIFVAAFPILIVYPFLQKYFLKGIIVGSVKG